MSNELFPKVKKSINDLIDDEEGNIPRSKLVVIGSTIMLMGMIMGIDGECKINCVSQGRAT